jgi:hypothetical protein
MTSLNRHSRGGGNPANKIIPRSGQNPTAYLITALDSRLRGNDEVLRFTEKIV